MGRRVTHSLLARADGPRREHRGGALSQFHLARVMGRRVTHNLLARADDPRREHRGGALSPLHLARAMGRRNTLNLFAPNSSPGLPELLPGNAPVFGSPPSPYPNSL